MSKRGSLRFTEQQWAEQCAKNARWFQDPSRNADSPTREDGVPDQDSQSAPAPSNPALPKLVDLAQQKARTAKPTLDFARMCTSFGLPEPQAEFRFHPKRRWRFDYAWSIPACLMHFPRRVALEVEGGIWTQGRHTRGAGAKADLEKYSEAAILGWRIVYCTPDELLTVGIERVKRALGLGGAEAA